MMRKRRGLSRPTTTSTVPINETLVLCENIHIQGFSLSLFAFSIPTLRTLSHLLTSLPSKGTGRPSPAGLTNSTGLGSRRKCNRNDSMCHLIIIKFVIKSQANSSWLALGEWVFSMQCSFGRGKPGNKGTQRCCVMEICNYSIRSWHGFFEACPGKWTVQWDFIWRRKNFSMGTLLGSVTIEFVVVEVWLLIAASVNTGGESCKLILITVTWQANEFRRKRGLLPCGIMNYTNGYDNRLTILDWLLTLRYLMEDSEEGIS